MTAWLMIDDALLAYSVAQALHRIAPDLPIIRMESTPSLTQPGPSAKDLVIIDAAPCAHVDPCAPIDGSTMQRRPALVILTPDGGFRPVLPGTLYFLGKRMRVEAFDTALKTICTLIRIMRHGGMAQCPVTARQAV
ncbi:MAG: hypothetical protein AB3X44_09710 [Leptothrix sp. (in: b-proteobacteria)]